MKNKKNPGNQTPSHSLFFGEIICGPHRGSFVVRDHLRSNLRIISGPGVICGRGSFAALYNTRDKQIELPLRGRPILLSLVWLQTEFDSTQSYYHY